MDLRTRTPESIDIDLAKNYEKVYALRITVLRLEERLERIERKERTFYRATDVKAELAMAESEITRLQAEAAPLDAEYRRRHWSRFFLVSDGHVHSSMSCHTCTWTTRFGWLPAMSGKTEADAVAEYGSMMCTVCFPSAPVDVVGRVQALAASEKAAKQAERAAKAEIKARKQLRADGQAVRVDRDRVYTIAEARRLTVDAMELLLQDAAQPIPNREYVAEQPLIIETLTQALSARLIGLGDPTWTVAKVTAELQGRAQAKFRRWSR
jgi:hypothetical protein